MIREIEQPERSKLAQPGREIRPAVEVHRAGVRTDATGRNPEMSGFADAVAPKKDSQLTRTRRSPKDFETQSADRIPLMWRIRVQCGLLSRQRQQERRRER